MKRAETSTPWLGIGSIATTLMIVAALYFAQDLFLPFALAALVTFLLAPVVAGLQRIWFPRAVAVVTTVVLALGGVVALGATLITQLDELSESLPKYRDTIREKLSALGGTVATIEKGLHDAMPDGEAPKLLPGVKSKPAPMEVKVVPDKPGQFELVGTIVGPVLGPLGTIAVVFVLVLFMLFYMEDLRDRMVSVISRRGVTVTTQAMSEVTKRISRYLLMTLIINASYGIPVGIGLLLLGVPNALLWGLLAIILRFIPYLGPWLAASFPILLSFAISPGWELTIYVTAMFLVLELVSNNVVEPWLYGSRTGLSPLAIIVAALFWTWLWGTAGLLLAVPLTLILVVSGRYVPQLRMLHTLLGDDPGLGPEARFYQRLVAANSDEAARVAEEFLDRRPLRDLYDAVVLPAMRSAKEDEAAGRLTQQAVSTIRETVREITTGLPAVADKKRARRQKAARAEAAEEPNQGLASLDQRANPRNTMPVAMPAGTAEVRVAFVPAGDDNDALVGQMLADLLRRDGITLMLVAPATLSSELVLATAEIDPHVIIIAGLPPVPHVRMRHLIDRIEDIEGDQRIIAGLWDAPVEEVQTSEPRRRIGFGVRRNRPTVLSEVRSPRGGATQGTDEGLIEAGAEQVVHTLCEAAEAVRRAVQHVTMQAN